MSMTPEIIQPHIIQHVLEHPHEPDTIAVKDILDKALELKGLDFDDVATLARITDSEQTQALFDTAKAVKEAIYGKRLVLFAPLYISNLCANDCAYCAFRVSNRGLARRRLSQAEIRQDTLELISQGHKRLLLVTGEAATQNEFEYILESIATVYDTKTATGEIRRVNVNIAPLSVEQFKELHAAHIGTYQIFQETYDRRTYGQVHISGKKRDYDWRLTAIDRAMAAGIDDVGVGILFGLSDWRFELMALMQHAAHLEQVFGVGPHTISVPRIEPASGSDLASAPPSAVSDTDFSKLIAILRCAVPYTGIILSTRENPEMRRYALALGISQISAGSKTDPGGYTKDQSATAAQFSLGDHRSLDEVIRDVASLGYIPSFCTGCYRRGRTGQDFMDLAKPGLIKNMCGPNAVATFQEYLNDFASEETKKIGRAAIQTELSDMPEERRVKTQGMLDEINQGKRDIFL